MKKIFHLMQLWLGLLGSMLPLAKALAATMTIVVGTGAGGSFDLYGRVFGPYLANALPDKPNLVIQNMPGAGGLRALAWIANTAPKDGSVIGLVTSGTMFLPIYNKTTDYHFNIATLNWIGSIGSAQSICVSWHSAGVNSFEDLLAGKKLIVGSSGPGTNMEIMYRMLNQLFHANLNIINGYKDGNAINLAMAQGEIGGRCGQQYSSIEETNPDWFHSSKVKIVSVFSKKPIPQAPDIKPIWDYATDDMTRQVLELLLIPEEIVRPLVAPPSIDPAKVVQLQQAFHKAINDPRFIEESKKHKLEIDEVSGPEISALLQKAASTPDNIIAIANQALQ
jgi:tripartite-type tricarboxylate transporter receptor subunit TctC